MIDLKPYTSFKVSASASSLFYLNKIEEIEPLKLYGEPFIVLGEGSNTLFVDNYLGCVLLNQLKGIRYEVLKDSTLVTASAGENWHNFVKAMLDKKLYGLENLAYIPGSVGASPIQNVGAYGRSVSDFIEGVWVFDLSDNKQYYLDNKACAFSYRNSAFKSTKWRSRYIILSVVFRLQHTFTPYLNYRGLDDLPEDCSAYDLFEKVITLRKEKLPDPLELANAGSFFKNPIITSHQLDDLLKDYPTMPYFLDKDKIKLSAAWLIEKLGFKGFVKPSGAGVYKNHALILVNHGQATGNDVYELACDIMAQVKDVFSIELEIEVRVIRG